MAVFNIESSYSFFVYMTKDSILMDKPGFWQIHIKNYLCKNFGFQYFGMKRESGVTPGLSPQL
ncbi:hypothetical protein HNP24_002321 [Chryseobacterium sediminis]|uniref:Transposase n=1 Tax=Chryseobacterium sediminis TaxID=1679494 RepID=A0ABR6Q072_9FLAO|nr:hypothetical protein [Chryseobacterium sediminis]